MQHQAAGSCIGAGIRVGIKRVPLESYNALKCSLLVADALRRGGMPGLWLVALGFCASVSRLSVTDTETALGALRIPVIAGGSLLAIALGLVLDPEFRISLRHLRP